MDDMDLTKVRLSKVLSRLNSIDPALSSNAMLSDGYDGIKLANGDRVIYKPEMIRSINADFDPEQSGSRNILYGIGGGALGVGALTQAQDEDKTKYE